MATKTVTVSDLSDTELDEDTHATLTVVLPGDIRYVLDVSTDEVRNILGEGVFKNGQQFIPRPTPTPTGQTPRGYYREIMSKFDASDAATLTLTCPANQTYSSFYQGFYSKRDFFEGRVKIQMNTREKTVTLVRISEDD